MITKPILYLYINFWVHRFSIEPKRTYNIMLGKRKNLNSAVVQRYNVANIIIIWESKVILVSLRNKRKQSHCKKTTTKYRYFPFTTRYIIYIYLIFDIESVLCLKFWIQRRKEKSNNNHSVHSLFSYSYQNDTQQKEIIIVICTMVFYSFEMYNLYY